MKLGDFINAWGPTMSGIALVIAALVLWERKHELPDHYEPITVEEADNKIEPLLFAAKVSVYNTAIRNIPYNWDRICFPPDGMGTIDRIEWNKTWKAKIKDEYKNHIWSHNGKHEYDGLTKSQVCAQRELAKQNK